MKIKPFVALAGLLFGAAWLIAQDCRGFMPFEKGTEWELTSFDKKGLAEGASASKLVALAPTESGAKATVENVFTDEKGREKAAYSFDFECKGDRMAMDLRSVLAPEQLGAYENMEMTFSGAPVEFPNRMEVGQSLPDADVKVQVKSNGMILMNMAFKLTNRKAVARERVETAAGAFDCIKTTYDSEAKLGFLTVHTTATQWLAEGVGLVKSESFDKKGKLTGSQQLTKFKRG